MFTPTTTASQIKVSELAPTFLAYCQIEAGFAPETIIKYQDCLRQLARLMDDPQISSINRDAVLSLKASLLARGLGVSRQTSILMTLKRLLRYCREERRLEALDPEEIRAPRRLRREVLFLTSDEVARFTNAIQLHTNRGGWHLSGIRFRALVEVILGTGMRISEVLSLNISDIDFPRREAKIVGKGSKQRVVFFTDRALKWVKRYLASRGDSHPALFVTATGDERLSRTDIWRFFQRYRKLAGIDKRI